MQESCMNPGSSQQTIDESRGVGNGYGLVHWDPPEKKFLEWAEEWYKHFQGESDIRDYYEQKGFQY